MNDDDDDDEDYSNDDEKGGSDENCGDDRGDDYDNIGESPLSYDFCLLFAHFGNDITVKNLKFDNKNEACKEEK